MYTRPPSERFSSTNNPFDVPEDDAYDSQGNVVVAPVKPPPAIAVNPANPYATQNMKPFCYIPAMQSKSPTVSTPDPVPAAVATFVPAKSSPSPANTSSPIVPSPITSSSISPSSYSPSVVPIPAPITPTSSTQQHQHSLVPPATAPRRTSVKALACALESSNILLQKTPNSSSSTSTQKQYPPDNNTLRPPAPSSLASSFEYASYDIPPSSALPPRASPSVKGPTVPSSYEHDGDGGDHHEPSSMTPSLATSYEYASYSANNTYQPSHMSTDSFASASSFDSSTSSSPSSMYYAPPSSSSYLGGRDGGLPSLSASSPRTMMMLPVVATDSPVSTAPMQFTQGGPNVQPSFVFPLYAQRLIPNNPAMRSSVSLMKGAFLNLTKEVPGLHTIMVGLGWDIRKGGGESYDLDASVFMLQEDGKVRDARDFVYYNNKVSVCGAIRHHGDNRTGVGEGDDERVTIDLRALPAEITKLIFAVSIHDAAKKKQSFGTVKRAFIRVEDQVSGQEVCRYDLAHEASDFHAMLFGEVFKFNGEWKFRAIGQGFVGGLRAVGDHFGVQLVSSEDHQLAQLQQQQQQQQQVPARESTGKLRHFMRR